MKWCHGHDTLMNVGSKGLHLVHSHRSATVAQNFEKINAAHDRKESTGQSGHDAESA